MATQQIRLHYCNLCKSTTRHQALNMGVICVRCGVSKEQANIVRLNRGTRPLLKNKTAS